MTESQSTNFFTLENLKKINQDMNHSWVLNKCDSSSAIVLKKYHSRNLVTKFQEGGWRVWQIQSIGSIDVTCTAMTAVEKKWKCTAYTAQLARHWTIWIHWTDDNSSALDTVTVWHGCEKKEAHHRKRSCSRKKKTITKDVGKDGAQIPGF